MIEANLRFLKTVLDLRTSASAAEAGYISDVIKMDTTLIRSGRSFGGLPGADKAAALAKELDLAAAYDLRVADVVTVFNATTAKEFDADGVTIVDA